MLLALCIAALVTFRILQCLDKKVIYYEGKCIEIVYTQSKVKSAFTVKRSYIILKIDSKNDNGEDVIWYCKIYTFNISNITKGNIIGVYTPISSVIQTAEDSFQINNPYFISIKKSNLIENEKNKENDNM